MTGEIACARCGAHLRLGTIAFMSRMRPFQAFDAWCARCAHQLVQWALAGAQATDLEGAADLMVSLKVSLN